MSWIAAVAVADSAADAAAAARSLKAAASDLARRWATQRLHAVQSLGRILADYGTGQASGGDAAQAYARLVMEEAVRYPGEAIQLATDYASAMARAAGLSTKTDVAMSIRAPMIDIDLSGPVGDVARRTFVLENPHRDVATIAFAAANFFDGERQVAAKPAFDPANLTIDARDERVITVSVRIDRRKFKAGRSYRANVAVEGFDDMVIRVHLTPTAAG